MASKPKKGSKNSKTSKASSKKTATQQLKSYTKSMKSLTPDYKEKYFKGSYTPTPYEGTYEPTEFTKEYNPEKYDSQYMGRIENTINNMENWSYDPLQDASYQALAKVYGARGNIAAKNSLADAAALNGGYGSSYAVSAAQQARNQYNQELASYIPQLEQAAFDRNQTSYNALMNLDDSLYGRFSDDETRKLQSLEYALDVAGFNEGNKQFAANYGLDVAKFNDDMNRFKFSSDLDAYGANQSERQFGYNADYTRASDAIGNAFNMPSFRAGLNALKPKTGTGGGGGGRRSSIGGGSGIGGYTSTPTTTTPTYDSTKQSVIMGSGKNGQNVRSAKGLTTIKEKNKRSGGRVIL